jgi:hypothetical protein
MRTGERLSGAGGKRHDRRKCFGTQSLCDQMPTCRRDSRHNIGELTTGAGRFRTEIKNSAKATLLVNTLFLADFAAAYTGRTCRVRDVFGAGLVVPNCLELLVVAFTSKEGA